VDTGVGEEVDENLAQSRLVRHDRWELGLLAVLGLRRLIAVL